MYIKKTLINYFKYYVTLCDLVIDIRYIYIIISRLLPLYYYIYYYYYYYFIKGIISIS